MSDWYLNGAVILAVLVASAVALAILDWGWLAAIPAFGAGVVLGAMAREAA